MTKLRKMILLCAAVAMLALTACGSEATVETPVETIQDNQETQAPEAETTAPVEETTPEETTQAPEVAPEGMKKSYLTGLWQDEEKVDRRPISIMLSNIKKATPQTGISKAAIIYEAPVEGMITRLMGVFEDYEGLEKIGSVRSARTYFVFWSEQWDSVYAHFGQCDYAKPYLNQIDNLNGVEGIGNTVYYRTSDRKAPHNAYASEEGLLAGIEKKGYRTHHEEDYTRGVFLFANEPGAITLENGDPATYVYPGFRDNSGDKIYFEYDEATKKYLRYQFGGPQIDDMTGEQLSVDNILIQYCDWEYYYNVTNYLWINIWDTNGNPGYYITQGKVIPIVWVGGVEYEPTKYYDLEGNELVMNPGQTWVCTVLDTDMEDTVIK